MLKLYDTLVDGDISHFLGEALNLDANTKDTLECSLVDLAVFRVTLLDGVMTSALLATSTPAEGLPEGCVSLFLLSNSSPSEVTSKVTRPEHHHITAVCRKPKVYAGLLGGSSLGLVTDRKPSLVLGRFPDASYLGTNRFGSHLYKL